MQYFNPREKQGVPHSTVNVVQVDQKKNQIFVNCTALKSECLSLTSKITRTNLNLCIPFSNQDVSIINAEQLVGGFLENFNAQHQYPQLSNLQDEADLGTLDCIKSQDAISVEKQSSFPEKLCFLELYQAGSIIKHEFTELKCCVMKKYIFQSPVHSIGLMMYKYSNNAGYIIRYDPNDTFAYTKFEITLNVRRLIDQNNTEYCMHINDILQWHSIVVFSDMQYLEYFGDFSIFLLATADRSTRVSKDDCQISYDMPIKWSMLIQNVLFTQYAFSKIKQADFIKSLSKDRVQLIKTLRQYPCSQRIIIRTFVTEIKQEMNRLFYLKGTQKDQKMLALFEILFNVSFASNDTVSLELVYLMLTKYHFLNVICVHEKKQMLIKLLRMMKMNSYFDQDKILTILFQRDKKNDFPFVILIQKNSDMFKDLLGYLACENKLIAENVVRYFLQPFSTKSGCSLLSLMICNDTPKIADIFFQTIQGSYNLRQIFKADTLLSELQSCPVDKATSSMIVFLSMLSKQPKFFNQAQLSTLFLSDSNSQSLLYTIFDNNCSEVLDSFFNCLYSIIDHVPPCLIKEILLGHSRCVQILQANQYQVFQYLFIQLFLIKNSCSLADKIGEKKICLILKEIPLDLILKALNDADFFYLWLQKTCSHTTVKLLDDLLNIPLLLSKAHTLLPDHKIIFFSWISKDIKSNLGKDSLVSTIVRIENSQIKKCFLHKMLKWTKLDILTKDQHRNILESLK